MSVLAWQIIAAVVKSGIAIFALLTVFAYMTLIERRVVARMQSRLGPNRAGPFGMFQPLADAIKMAFKEQIIPTRARLLVFLAAPCISIFIALVAFAVVPLGDTTTWGTGPIAEAWAPYIARVNVGLLYILAISSLAVYGIVLGGWSSGNRYSLLGALRSAAQMVSYEVSIALSLAGAIMFAGTLDMVGIVQSQVAQHIWFVLAQPLGFILYGIAAVAEVNRAPFDLPEAEQELVAGYLTEFSGLRWSLFQMAEYVNMITVSSLAVTLYFGGWTIGALDGIPGAPFIPVSRFRRLASHLKLALTNERRQEGRQREECSDCAAIVAIPGRNRDCRWKTTESIECDAIDLDRVIICPGVLPAYVSLIAGGSFAVAAVGTGIIAFLVRIKTDPEPQSSALGPACVG